MVSNNIILAVPSANSSVNYELPPSESAKLSFSPEDIDGIKLNANGGLEISFVEGGQVTLTNFQSFIDNGNTLSLADGTNVDPKLLFTALGGHAAPTNDTLAGDIIKIDVPTANAHNEITLEPGQKYLLNFDLSETTGADVKNGNMEIGFANGGKITIANYETAMAGATPAELSLAAKTCVVSGDELITNIQKLAATQAAEEVAVVEEVVEEVKPKSKIAAADMDGNDNSGIVDPTGLGYRDGEVEVANIEPAAGGEADIARELAQIETAAGPAGGAGGRAGGYGFGSRPGAEPFQGKPDIGPIDPTQLGYRAPELSPSVYVRPNNPGIPNSIPVIGPGANRVDETNLKDGNLTVSGDISINYGNDRPGTIAPNDDFSSGGSRTNDALTSGGQPITVNVVENSYVGTTPDGTVIFELVINPTTGGYTYTQFGPIDHADGNNPDDEITLEFGVIVTDHNGDSATTTITITVADDAPEIEGDEKTVDETDLGPITITDTLEHNFNQDGAGSINVTNSFESSGSRTNDTLSSSGQPVTVNVVGNSYVGTTPDGTVIFELSINPATGQYTYTQYGNLDHADGNDPNDIITLKFGVEIVDFDGDKAAANIVINIKDDAPIFQPPEPCGCTPPGEEPPPPFGGNPKPDSGLEIVDETGLKTVGSVVETGRLDADFGGDAPGSYAFQDGSFASSGSKANGNLTHNGVPVVVTLVDGEWVGFAGDKQIFKLELDTATGDYRFTLYDNLDHANKTDPDDQIVLDFAVIASDFDGDSAAGSIRIIVKDDGPVANNDVNTYDTPFGVANGNVITGENGGPGAADNLSTDEFATGPANKVVKIAFEGNEVDVPATGTVSIDGAYGTLTIAADGTYTYKAFDDSGIVTPGGAKEFVSGPALPDFDEGQALDGVERQSLGVAPENLSLNGGETITVTYRSEGAGYNNTLGAFTVGPDGTISAEGIVVRNGNNATVGQSFTYQAGADASSFGLFLIANGSGVNNAYAGIDFSTGSLNFIHGYGTAEARDAKITDNGADIRLVYTSSTGVETVLNGPLYFTTDRSTTDNLNADGSVRVVSGIPGDDNSVLRIGFEDLPNLGDKDYNDMVFDVTVTAPACGCQDPDIQDQFVYTIEDSDGDRDTATLTLNGQDLTDDKPVLVKPDVEIVDETNLVSGALSETGKVDVDFGHDGPGTINGNGSFTSGGSRLDDKLTSGGVAVEVKLNGNTYTGTANGVTVFTLTIQNDGSYTYNQFKPLDHADGTNHDDIITLNFGVVATDCDGDASTTTIVVNVRDDGPVAKNDSNSASEGQTVAGNVITNDVVGQDTPGTITKVTFGGREYDLTTGPKTIVGQYGTLEIDSTGAYTYKANSNNPDGTDRFVYTLRDGDGDTSTAKLSIDVTSVDDCPVIKPSIEKVDETDLKNGVITQDGSVTVDYGSDAPGQVTGNGSFNSGGSRLDDKLTHNGHNVDVKLEGNTYTGTANGVTVFTLTIATDGSYSFKLYEQLDHADGTDANDIITLNFGVTATDSDGDTANTTITIKVADDAPTAKNDSNSAEEGQTVRGNVTTNDSVGQDEAGSVTKVTFGGREYDLTTGPKTIVGQYGTLEIDSTGAYSYKANSNNPDGTDNFVYTLRDRDGDTATAKLSINVTSVDDCPVIKPSIEKVDETDLSGGVITKDGSVHVNYFGDGPGEVTGNGSFTSGGSRLNNKLTSGGEPVEVKLEGNTYTGTAKGVTVFTLTIATDGTYSFKLYEQLDHADGTDANDIITLDFGVTATDADGDKASTTITIKVADDAPDAKDDSNSASEGQTVAGNVITNDVVGQDEPGTITKVTFGGREYDLTTGPKTITGQYGVLTIDSKGDYTYKANSNNPNGTDRFVYTLKDRDGDVDTAKLVIDVTSVDDCPVIKPSYQKVDETDLKSGVITQTGSVTVDYGSDAPGKVEGNGSFTSGGSRLNDKLTSGGVAVEVKLEGNTYTGTANGTTVFTLTVATSGSYTFKLYEQLDHADGSNANDIITLDFGVVATDADGDKASTTITIKVADDAPDAKDDYQSMVNGTSKIDGNVTDNDVVGQDTPGTVISISFGGQTKAVPENGTVSINGQYGTLVIDSTGAYTYTAKPNAVGKDNFTYVLKDGDGDTDPAKLTIDVKENPIVVCIFADDICIKEDTSGAVPVHAYITGGNGNETMTVTMTGVPAGWTVTAPGWVKSGSEYTLTLPQGVSDWKGSVTFKPPANSDADLTSLVFKNTVYDPDTKATTFATENAKVIVDAVIDPFKFQATLQENPSAPNSGKIFVMTKQGAVQHSKLSIFNLTRPDADGSESLKKIIFTLQAEMAKTTHISLKNADGTFTQVGTKSTSGKDTVYTIDLSGMTYEQAVNYITKNLYLTNTGKSGLDHTYDLGIQIVSYEKNLSGVEKDYSDNETSYTVCVPVDFCISPLVIDLDRDGVELLSKEAGVLFDMTNDGVTDKTGWVASDDAFLVLDKNGDGTINDRTELFGNDDVFANGFDNLASYDLNGDGVIDAKDAVFADLRVWQDVNGDGISQADELKTLADVKIAAINLGAAEVSYDIAGNPITHESQVVFEDGGSSAIVDAWFEYEGGAGGNGVDKGLTLRGTDGNDVISGSSGSDDLYGGLGADTFLFQTISEGVDTLKDFSAADGDKIDLSNILTHFDPLTDAINDFVFATETDDGKTILSVNTNGTGSADAQQLAIIETGNVNVSDLFNNGSIIV